jgi:hypothetical protein
MQGNLDSEGIGSTAFGVVNPLKNRMLVQRTNFVLFLIQPSPQLINNCTIPFPLYREFQSELLVDGSNHYRLIKELLKMSLHIEIKKFVSSTQ